MKRKEYMSALKKYPVAVQLYSLREEAKRIGYIKVLERVSEYGYSAVEFAGFYDKKPREIRKALDDLGLTSSSAHGAVPTNANVAQIVDAAKEIGYKWHVTGFEEKLLTGESDCRKKAELLQAGAEILKKEGLRLAYHNHWWEFDKKFNGKYPHQIIMENAPDVYAQVDTYWAAVGGANVPEITRQLKTRIPMLHVKDGPINKEQPMTAVGEGKMDWKPVMSAINENILEWLIVELDWCATDMFEAVRKSVIYLVNNGFGRARDSKQHLVPALHSGQKHLGAFIPHRSVHQRY